MRTPSFPLLLACLTVSAAMAQQLPDAPAADAPRLVYDHYDPVLLNEFAIDAIRRGDLTMAGILLERAVRLAPYDPRIVRNLRELQAYRTGKPAPSGAPAPVAPRDTGTDLPAEPPALWPSR